MNLHCPYCKDGFPSLREAVACAACHARHHRECFEDHGACATCESPELLVRRDARHHERRGLDLGATLAVVAVLLLLSNLVTYCRALDWLNYSPTCWVTG